MDDKGVFSRAAPVLLKKNTSLSFLQMFAAGVRSLCSLKLPCARAICISKTALRSERSHHLDIMEEEAMMMRGSNGEMARLAGTSHF